MANQPLQIIKTVSGLPDILAPNCVYLVRVGDGFDIYVSDATGQVAYKTNSASGGSGIQPSTIAGQVLTTQNINGEMRLVWVDPDESISTTLVF